MKRKFFTIFVVGVVLGFAVLALGKATRAFYTMESVNFFTDNPMLYITHEADGWLHFQGVPIGGTYVRQINGEEVPGALTLEASAKMSVDFADGNAHGLVTLWIEDMECSGRFRAKRVNYFETGSWVLQCTDGSKIHDTWHFTDTGEPTWTVEGSGMLLIPHG